MNEQTRYAKAGVDIEAGDRLKKRLIELTQQTHNEHVIHKSGAFGGLYSLEGLNVENPVLVSSVDGVGTKTKIACTTGQHKGIGIDIVNHCINDILTCGAEPLFFLDYFACGKQNDDVVMQLIEGMSDACKKAGMALIGGETAQMPDIYAENEYDLAGTIVGVVDQEKMIDGRDIQPGDMIFALPSSGLHTNGYTLARKVLLEENSLKLDEKPKNMTKTLGEALLAPHRSYLDEIREVRSHVHVKGIAHITGGSFEGNISRILPDGCKADIYPVRWQPPSIFYLIQELGNISKTEMYQVFNMGMGIAFVVGMDDRETIKDVCWEADMIGQIVEGSGVELIMDD